LRNPLFLRIDWPPGRFFANPRTAARLAPAARIIKPQFTEFSTAFVDKLETRFRVRD